MKYFIDTEFIEGFHKPLFGKKRHFIDLISIAIVAEDGREYYAISTEFNPKDADDWVWENVIDKLPQKATSFYDSPRLKANNLLYKTNKQIAKDIKDFVLADIQEQYKTLKYSEIEFYAYYADYDWVVFCSLFGRMIDLPKGFPMYCRDLKQMLDEKAEASRYEEAPVAIATFNSALEELKSRPDYPKQQNEHSALDDARWNKRLFDFLKTVSVSV